MIDLRPDELETYGMIETALEMREVGFSDEADRLFSEIGERLSAHRRDDLEREGSSPDSPIYALSETIDQVEIAEEVGDFQSAADYFRELRRISEEVRDPELALSVNPGLSRVLRENDRYGEALIVYEDQVEVASQLGNVLEEGLARLNAAEMRLHLGLSLEDVEPEINEAIRCFESAGDPETLRLAEERRQELLSRG